MKKTAQMTQVRCLIAMLLALPLSVLANKLLEPGTSGGIGGTGNTPTTTSDDLLQPSSAKNKHGCPENRKVGSYRLESAGTVSVSSLCIGQEIELLNGDQLQMKVSNSGEVSINALGRVRIKLLQSEEHKDQAQNFDIKFFIDSGRTLIFVDETRIEGATDLQPRLLVRDGVIQ